MDATTFWWLAVGALVVADLFGGTTFYLLMLAVGAAAGALLAHAGSGMALQVGAAGVVALAAVAALHVAKRRRRAQAPAPSANRDVLLDVGERVDVAQWRADGSAEVRYRGSTWHARHVGRDAPRPGAHRIAAIDGAELQLVAEN